MFSRYLLPATLLLYAALAVAASVITPTFEFLDERDHFAYVRYLWVERSLPALRRGEVFEQFYQPPLYYLVGMLAALPAASDLSKPIEYRINPFFKTDYWAANNDNKNLWLHTTADDFPFGGTARAVHFARLASAAFGLANGIAVLALGKEVFRERKIIAGFAALALLLPGYIAISGVLSNDNAATLGGTLVLLFCWRLCGCPDQRRHWLGLAASISVATLAKVTTLFLWPSILVTVMIAWRKASDRRRLAAHVLLFVTLWTLTTGWWFARNIALYGDPTAISASQAQLGQGGEFSPGRMRESLPYLQETFVGRFANTTYPLPSIVYVLFLWFTAAAALGWLFRLIGRERQTDHLPAGWLVTAAAAGGMAAAVLYHSATNNTGAQGRLLYPASAAIAALALAGWLWPLPARYRDWAGAAVWAGAAALATASVALWMPEPIALPRQFENFRPPEGFQALDYRYDDSIVLLGYTASARRAQPGDSIEVKLYWRSDSELSADYAVFLQLADDSDRKAAQRDTFSGGGLFPTSRWLPGRVVEDSITLTINSDAPSPQLYYLTGGLWDLASGQRLPVRGESALARLYRLGEVMVISRSDLAALPPELQLLSVQFGTGISLHSCAAPTAANGNMTLAWQASADVDDDYKIFTHVWDSSGRLLARLDHAPAKGILPTRFWNAGDLIVDPIALPANREIARVDVGLYASDSLQRLPVIDPPSADGVYSLPRECWAR